MKRNIAVITGLAGLLMLALATPSFADEKGKEVTITGEGQCAKCILKEADACQHTITTEEGGRQVTYYLAQNDVAKEFGNQLCKEKKKIKVTGTVKTVGGKQELTATKMELGAN